MITLAPKAGFDWLKVKWGKPDARRTNNCSYCGARFPDDDDDGFVPLILWSKRGDCAEFCEECQRKWWGLENAGHDPECNGSD